MVASRMVGSLSAIVAHLAFFVSLTAQAAPSYKIYVTNEKSDDVTVINGGDFTVAATLSVGKRPRGIHLSPDGKSVLIALSGTVSEGPPSADKKARSDADDKVADKSADGVGVLDLASGKIVKKIHAGSDPEEFAVSKDGKYIYISNEDAKTVSVVSIAADKIEHTVHVGPEPEGVTVTPDGAQFYVTCEAAGDVYVINTKTYAETAHFNVNGRPRSVDFLHTAPIAFIPSESVGELNVIDTDKAAVIKTITLPTGSRPMRVRVAADGKKLYMSNGRGGTIAVVDTRSYELLETIKVGDRPWGIEISPDGKYLFSANGPSNDVSVVDLATNQELTRVKAGASPWGIAVVPTK